MPGTKKAEKSVAKRPKAARKEGAESAVSSETLAVLSALNSAWVVLGPRDKVVLANPTAYSFGLVRAGRLAPERLLRLVRHVRLEGGVRDEECEVRRGRRTPSLVLDVRVAPLQDELMLVLAEDRSNAARVDAVRRDFVANVSHELKTPVGALALLAEAVNGAYDDPEAVRRFATRMQHEAARLSQLVQDLIALSRLESDDPTREPDVVHVDDVVSDAIDQVHLEAQAHHIDLVVGGQHGVNVLGQRDQLVTAMRNVLINAINYSPDHTKVVVNIEQDEGTASISITDQGIGVPRSEQERIFERFYRIDPARSRATGGTGLGLSIVKHVAARHGGDVEIWSQEGAGSTFTLRLPVHVPRRTVRRTRAVAMPPDTADEARPADDLETDAPAAPAAEPEEVAP